MFIYLAFLVVYCLLSFGAVLPQNWLAVEMFWVAGILGLAIRRILKDQKLDLIGGLLWAASALLVFFVAPKFGVGVTAVGWAGLAARQSESRTLRFFHFLLGIGFLEALLGLVQFFVLPGWILGYEGINRSSGTLINRNHFAGILEMLIPVAFGLGYLAFRRHRDISRSYLYIFIGAFMGVALVFSLSKMGIFSFLMTLILLSALMSVRSGLPRLASILGLGLLGLVFVGALWIGIDVVVERYADLFKKDALVEEGRTIVFRDTLQLIKANPLGVGIGRYVDVFRQFQTYHTESLFDHAHNDYLETTAEWGIPIAVLFWTVIAWVVLRSVRALLSSESIEKRAVLLACIGSICSILLHSFTDFNLQIPSNAMLFFTFLGIAFAYSRRSRNLLTPTIRVD